MWKVSPGREVLQLAAAVDSDEVGFGAWNERHPGAAARRPQPDQGLHAGCAGGDFWRLGDLDHSSRPFPLSGTTGASGRLSMVSQPSSPQSHIRPTRVFTGR